MKRKIKLSRISAYNVGRMNIRLLYLCPFNVLRTLRISTRAIEEILITVILAVVAIPLGLRVSEDPEFFFRNNVLLFKRSVVLTIIWIGGFIVRVFLEIFYSTGNNLINFIVTGLLAFTLGLIIGERYMIYKKGEVIQKTGKIAPDEEFAQ